MLFRSRAEFNQNMTDSGHALSAVDVNTGGGRFVIASDGAGNLSPAAATLLPLLPVPYVSSAAAGWNASLLQNTLPRLAPRGGFAWNLPGDVNTVIRASFGIYPNQAAYSIITNFAQNLPFFYTKTVNSAVAQAPSFSTRNALAVNAKSEHQTLAGLVAWLKANPQSSAFGTPGLGTPQQFLGTMLGRDAGIEYNHVPYKGGAPAMQDLLGNQISSAITAYATAAAQAQIGRAHV